MNILFDTDSSDSDTRRRYKTEATRGRKGSSHMVDCGGLPKKYGNLKYKSPCSGRHLIKQLKSPENISKEKEKNKYKDKEHRYRSSYQSTTYEKLKKRHGKHWDEKKVYQSKESDICGRKETKKKNGDFVTCSIKKNTEGNLVQDITLKANPANISTCGPSLPPHLEKMEVDPDLSDKTPMITVEKIYGPSLPNNFKSYAEPKVKSSNEISENKDNAPIGPIFENIPYKCDTYLQLEKRALELKLANLNKNQMGKRYPNHVREEWMIELPELRNVTDYRLTARQFRTKEYDINKDRSIWTETPSDRERKVKEKDLTYNDTTKSHHQKWDKANRERRDDEQEHMVQAHKKTHKRDESLLAIHQKKIKMKSNMSAEHIERRPFSRETDLKVNRFDQSIKKNILKKAQLLNTRFGTGQTKYL